MSGQPEFHPGRPHQLRSTKAMSSKRRRAASRANGKKSHGPVTPEGKARSAMNATRHGLASTSRLANSVCLSTENREDFIRLHEILITEHLPQNPCEHQIVEELAVARWRLQRMWTVETHLLENQMDSMSTDVEKDWKTMDEGTRLALAFRKLSETSPSLALQQRYETRLTRQIESCRRQLADRRSQPPSSAPNSPLMPTNPSEIIHEPNKPSPKIEHAPAPAEHAGPTASAAQSASTARPGITGSGQTAPAASTPEVGILHLGPEPVDSEPQPRTTGWLLRAA